MDGKGLRSGHVGRKGKAYVFLGPRVQRDVERVSFERAVERHDTQVRDARCPFFRGRGRE